MTSWAAWCASRALVLELAAALGACGARAAQDGDAYVVLAEQEQVARYDRFELTVRPAPGHTMDAKSKVMVVFRSPSGHVQRVGAFVRAPGHAVRFAPREEGTYHYEVMVLGAGKERVVSREAAIHVALCDS